MKRPYETMIVFDGTIAEDSLNRECSKVEEFLAKNAEFEKLDLWGRRQLAYEIKKRTSGHYCLFQYQAEGNVVPQLDRILRLNESVLRHLSVVRTSAPFEAPAGMHKEPVIETGDDE